MTTKQKLGQFYTTNYDYILQNLYIPKNIIKIIEPFAGNGDLLNFIKDKEYYELECYDIEPKKDYIIEKNMLCLHIYFLNIYQHKNYEKTNIHLLFCNIQYRIFTK